MPAKAARLPKNNNHVHIFSILDQQQKQAIPFQGGVVLGDYEGLIFVASGKEIYSLVSVPFEKQVRKFHGTNRE